MAGVLDDARRNAAIVFADVPDASVVAIAQKQVPGADVNGPQVMMPLFQIWDGEAAVAVVGE
jgi:hypothetical protein